MTGALLCLPPLEYQQDYRLIIADLRGANNEKLESAYTLSFTTPRRRASLAVAGDGTTSDIARWNGETPALRAVNVTDAHVEIYRVTRFEDVVEAWSHRLQITLAPSESIYFARHKGERVAETDMHFDANANNNSEMKPAFATDMATFTPGLYLIAATTPAPTADSTDTPEPGLAPEAAKWFLHSTLKIHALKTGEGFYIFSEKTDGIETKGGVALTLLDKNQTVVR